jgi:DNA primase
MRTVDEIKSRLDIVQVAGEYLPLERRGKHWVTRCPFHEDRNPSLVIFPDSQRWKCFGSSCNLGGDLIDLLQKLQKWDFTSTLRFLADKAGVELQPLSEQDRSLAEHRQTTQRVLGVAMAYFQQQLLRGVHGAGIVGSARVDPGLNYALARGWTRETLVEAGIGSFGSDYQGLRRWLLQAGLDLELPAVVALLGLKGNLREWADKQGLEAPRSWVEQKRIPGMPAHMLIYPHMERGRVVYLAGRSILAKKHWNPPRELVGPRQPYYNSCWWKPEVSQVLIVEGQGDALTLAQWELAAVALAGCLLSRSQAEQGGLLQQILKKAQAGKVLIGLDADGAGLEARQELAGILLKAGLAADSLGILTWPKADPNEWLANGATLEEMTQLLDEAPSWLDLLVQKAAGDVQDEATLAAVFEALLSLPHHKLILQRDRVCKDLNLRKTYFDEMLRLRRSHQAEKNQDSHSDWGNSLSYQVLSGCVYQRSLNSEGCEVMDKLSNFTARIEQEIGRDDGQQVELEFRICGEVDGKAMPTTRVLAEDFDHMGWVVKDWGAAAIIEAGIKRRDQLRAAIQYLSKGFAYRKVFTHTGWCKVNPPITTPASGQIPDPASARAGDLPDEPVDGQEALASDLVTDLIPDPIIGPKTGCLPGSGSSSSPDCGSGHGPNPGSELAARQQAGDNARVYLSGTGGLGHPEIEVDLDFDLRKYCLPQAPGDPVAAMRASLEFIKLASFEITTPVWAAIWLAPLSELVRTNFVLWLYGRTGTLKSTLAALALNHYGPDFDGFQFPANFSDTPGRLEHKAFLLKDALLVVDDYAPQKTLRDVTEYKRAANHIIRAVGNQAGRGRLTREIQGRRSFTPRGVVMATGEDLPETESLLARLFVVELQVDSIDRDRLSAMQAERWVYAHALAGYLTMLAQNWSAYQRALPKLWERYRRKATSQGIHLRLPETVASLMIGWEMGLRYALSIEALHSEEYKLLMDFGWQALVDSSQTMMSRAAEEKPEEMFVRTLKELLAQGKIYLKDKHGGQNLGGEEDRAEMLGWHDLDYLYLLPQVTFARIAKHFREQGNIFPLRQGTLWKGLREVGWLAEPVSAAKGGVRSTRTEWLEGKIYRVLVMRREILREG